MTTRKASRLHQIQNTCAILIAAVFVLGIAAAPTHKHEIFPFFCWFLFSQTPGVENHYELFITAYDGKTLSRPQSFMKSSLVKNRGQESSTNAHRIIEALGKAIVAGDLDAIREHRRMIEGNYFTKPVTYRIKMKTYDPIQYRRTGQAQESVLAAFQSDTPTP